MKKNKYMNSSSSSYLSQRYDALDVGVADVEVRDFLFLLGARLTSVRIFHPPMQSLGGNEGDDVLHLKVQLHHFIGRTFQPMMGNKRLSGKL